MNYNKTVAQNLSQMGTNSSDWRALPVVGSAEAEDDKGRKRLMPVFDFSVIKGFTKPATMFPCGSDMADGNCELCGHKIKNVYHIYAPEFKYHLMVGSECVTHFNEGESGEQQLRAARIEEAKKLDKIGMEAFEAVRTNMSEVERRRRVYYSANINWKAVSIEVVKALAVLGTPYNMYMSGDKTFKNVSKIAFNYEWVAGQEGTTKADAGLLSWYKRVGAEVQKVADAVKVVADYLEWK